MVPNKITDASSSQAVGVNQKNWVSYHSSGKLSDLKDVHTNLQQQIERQHQISLMAKKPVKLYDLLMDWLLIIFGFTLISNLCFSIPRILLNYETMPITSIFSTLIVALVVSAGGITLAYIGIQSLKSKKTSTIYNLEAEINQFFASAKLEEGYIKTLQVFSPSKGAIVYHDSSKDIYLYEIGTFSLDHLSEGDKILLLKKGDISIPI